MPGQFEVFFQYIMSHYADRIYMEKLIFSLGRHKYGLARYEEDRLSIINKHKSDEIRTQRIIKFESMIKKLGLKTLKTRCRSQIFKLFIEYSCRELSIDSLYELRDEELMPLIRQFFSSNPMTKNFFPRSMSRARAADIRMAARPARKALPFGLLS